MRRLGMATAATAPSSASVPLPPPPPLPSRPPAAARVVDAWVQLARHQPERRGYFRGDEQEQPPVVVVEQRRNGPAGAASSPPLPPPPPPPPPVAPLRRLLTVTRQQARQLSADDAASVLWALAKLGPPAGGGGGGAASSSSAAAIAAAAADAGVLEALLARVVARNSSTTTTAPTTTPTTASPLPSSPLPSPPLPRSAALSAWALARLGWSPEPRLWDAFFGAAAPAARLGLFSARDLSNVAWALARLRQRPSPAWLRAFCAAAEPWLLPMTAEGAAASTALVDSQSLATLLLGLANLPPAPSGAGGASSTAAARAQQQREQQKQKQPDASAPLATWAERVLTGSPALRASGLATLDARALASIPGALHKLGAGPEALRPWLASELAPEALRRLTASAASAAALTAKDVAELGWALERAFAATSATTHEPLPRSVRKLRAALARRLAQMLESCGGEEVVGRVPAASATAQALRALVALGGRRQALSDDDYDDSAAIHAAAAATARSLPRLLPRAALRDVADLAWALAEESGGGAPSASAASSAAAARPSLLAATRRLLSSPGAAASDPRAVAVALAGLARLQQQQKQQQQQQQQSSAEDVPPPAPAPPGWQWFLPVFEATRPLMIPAARCPWAARDLAMAGWAVARLGQRPPAAWLGAYLAAVRAQLLPPQGGDGSGCASSFSPLAHAAWAIAHPSWGLTPRRLEELAPGFAGEFAAAVLSAASSSSPSSALTAAEAAALLRAVPAVLGASSPTGAACARAMLEAARPALRRCCSDGLEAAQQPLSLRELLHLTLPAARLAARPRTTSGDGSAAAFDDAGWAADAAGALEAAADASQPVPTADLSAALAVVGRLYRATATASAATYADRARLSRAADALATRLAAALGNNAGLDLASAAATAAAAAARASPAGASAVLDAALRHAADDEASAVRRASLEELARLLQAAAAIVRQQQDQAAEAVCPVAISTVLDASDARLIELLPVDDADEAHDEAAAALEEQQQQLQLQQQQRPQAAAPRHTPSLPTPLDRRPDRPQPQPDQPQRSTRATARDRTPSRPSSARAAAAVLCAFAALRPQSSSLPPPEAAERLLRLAAAQDGGSLRALSGRQAARLAHAIARLYHGGSSSSALPPAWLLPALWQRLSLPVRRPLAAASAADPISTGAAPLPLLPPSSAAAAVAIPSVACPPQTARIGDMVEASAALAALTTMTTSATAEEEDGLLPPPLAAQVFRTAGRRWAELLAQPPQQQVRLLRALVRLAPLVSEGTVAHFARGVLEAEEGAPRGSGGEGETEEELAQKAFLTLADRLRRRRLRSALAAMWSACRVNKKQQQQQQQQSRSGRRPSDPREGSGGGLVVVATSDDGRVPAAVMPSAAAAAAAASRASAVAV